MHKLQETPANRFGRRRVIETSADHGIFKVLLGDGCVDEALWLIFQRVGCEIVR